MAKKRKIVFGVDEVGRGALCGPVVACAMTKIKNQSSKIKNANQKSKIKDSKKLTSKQREKIYWFLKENSDFVFAVSKVGERVIDKINIFEATKLTMKRAVLGLEKKLGKKADLLLLDGNFTIPLKRKQKPIIKGDEKEPLIAFASIIAKVERDNLMRKQSKQYPNYGFEKHKGYGTKEHFDMLTKFGPCEIHRTSFAPIKQALLSE